MKPIGGEEWWRTNASLGSDVEMQMLRCRCSDADAQMQFGDHLGELECRIVGFFPVGTCTLNRYMYTPYLVSTHVPGTYPRDRAYLACDRPLPVDTYLPRYLLPRIRYSLGAGVH